MTENPGSLSRKRPEAALIAALTSERKPVTQKDRALVAARTALRSFMATGTLSRYRVADVVFKIDAAMRP